MTEKNQLHRSPFGVVALALLVVGGTPSAGRAAADAVAIPAAATAADRLSFADVADLFLDAPLVMTARIARATPLPAVSATRTRMYVEGDVVRLIRGPGAVPTRVAWLVDVPLDARGRPAKLKNNIVMLAALPVPARPGEVRLAAPDAMLPWSAPFEARVRQVVAAGLAPDSPPRVTGIASAFHVAGTLTGEGETQIFLTTARAQPVSLTVLSRPGQPRRWAVALGEIVDEAAAPPPADTLGWYRLACSLPPALPAAATGDLAASDADAARRDYTFVIASLGACTRTRR